MGCESYEGAIGGYLFVCSSTGDMHHKLYASHEQFPAAMFQFLVHVESEGYSQDCTCQRGNPARSVVCGDCSSCCRAAVQSDDPRRSASA